VEFNQTFLCELLPPTLGAYTTPMCDSFACHSFSRRVSVGMNLFNLITRVRGDPGSLSDQAKCYIKLLGNHGQDKRSESMELMCSDARAKS